MSNTKRWKSGSAALAMAGSMFKDVIDRVATEEKIASFLASFLHVNDLAPGEVIITGRSEFERSKAAILHLVLFTSKNEKEIESIAGFSFNLN